MITNADLAYKQLVASCLAGEKVNTRNSWVYRSLSYQFTFDKFPLVSVRKTAWKSALREWEWFMSGSHNVNDLHESVRHWWKPWANERGNIPYNYGSQFRYYQSVGQVDQIAEIIEGVKEHPYSRRNVITSWNAFDMRRPECPLTNCHTSFAEFSGSPDGKLHYHTVQRSADVIVGLGANWAQSWAFLVWVAHLTGRQVGTMTWTGIDCHVYEQHEEVARKITSAFVPQKSLGLVYTPTSEKFLADDFTLDGEYLPVVCDKVEMVV